MPSTECRCNRCSPVLAARKNSPVSHCEMQLQLHRIYCGIIANIAEFAAMRGISYEAALRFSEDNYLLILAAIKKKNDSMTFVF